MCVCWCEVRGVGVKVMGFWCSRAGNGVVEGYGMGMAEED